MRNIALELTYLGTAYHGWQVQKNLPTVAQTLEEAAQAVVGHKVHMTGCGRTDAGVHAKHYIANFRTTSTIPCARLPYALNTQLPPDIVVNAAMDVHEDFNAIGSCVRKEYTYCILQFQHPRPVLRESGVVLSQASGRKYYGRRRTAVCGHP